MEKLNSMLETAGQLTPSSFYEDEYGQITFLPAPIFSPTWPTKNKLAHTALTLLLDGRLGFTEMNVFKPKAYLV
jgi:hypothetical protein